MMSWILLSLAAPLAVSAPERVLPMDQANISLRDYMCLETNVKKPFFFKIENTDSIKRVFFNITGGDVRFWLENPFQKFAIVGEGPSESAVLSWGGTKDKVEIYGEMTTTNKSLDRINLTVKYGGQTFIANGCRLGPPVPPDFKGYKWYPHQGPAQ